MDFFKGRNNRSGAKWHFAGAIAARIGETPMAALLCSSLIFFAFAVLITLLVFKYVDRLNDVAR